MSVDMPDRSHGSSTELTGTSARRRTSSGRRPSSTPRRSPRRARTLIDWQEADKNSHLLDWRERAHDFGLVPVARRFEDETGFEPPVAEPPERLLHDEEPEAFEEQFIPA